MPRSLPAGKTRSLIDTATVREIFDAISSQLRYDVFYNGEQLDLNRKVKFAQQVLNLEQVLDAVANNRFKYTWKTEPSS